MSNDGEGVECVSNDGVECEGGSVMMVRVLNVRVGV